MNPKPIFQTAISAFISVTFVCLGVAVFAQEWTRQIDFIPYYFFERTSFSQTLTPWFLHRVELSQRWPRLAANARLDQARRFDRWGRQYEIDLYPKLGKTSYVYLSAGFSVSDIFPRQRFGAECFGGLPKSFELSGGARRLLFSETSVTAYTISLGKYLGPYWFAYRIFYTPQEIGAGRSDLLSLRRYFGASVEFIGVSFGEGASPDRNVSLDIFTLKSRQFLGEIKKRLLGSCFGQLAFNFERQQITASTHRWQRAVGAGLFYWF